MLQITDGFFDIESVIRFAVLESVRNAFHDESD
jgi:hypothetical protein